MIPNGWSENKLSALCEKIAVGLAISVTPYMRKAGTKLIRNQNIKRNYFKTKSVVYIDDDFADKNKSKKVYAGDVVAVRTGSNIGEACVVPKEFDGALTFTTLIARPNPLKLSSEFLGLHINSEKGISEVNRLMAGGGKPNLNSGELKNYKLLTPPIDEQRKIANILGTWDKAINTTERLIENSKQHKKSLMHQILTGKERFTGFKSEWEELKLADIGKCISGLTYSPSDIVERDGMLVLRSSNVQGGKLAFNDNVFVNSELKVKSKTQEGDILICVRNGSKHLIGKSALIKGRAVNEAHGAFMTLYRCKYPDYVFQLFQTAAYYSQVNKNLGATINSINNSDLHKFKFLIPTDEKERALISECLINADKEIDILEQQLTDLKQEKKALMQQLLTGKRRVII